MHGQGCVSLWLGAVYPGHAGNSGPGLSALSQTFSRVTRITFQGSRAANSNPSNCPQFLVPFSCGSGDNCRMRQHASYNGCLTSSMSCIDGRHAVLQWMLWDSPWHSNMMTRTFHVEIQMCKSGLEMSDRPAVSRMSVQLRLIARIC